MLASDELIWQLQQLQVRDLQQQAFQWRLVTACCEPGWVRRATWAVGRLCIAAGERLLVRPQPEAAQVMIGDNLLRSQTA